jgi:hypothetical protein
MRVMIAFVLLMALAHTAVADPQQHGNIIFDSPVGWTEGGVQDD